MERFIDYFTTYLEEQKRMIGYGVTQNTIKTYNCRITNVKEFLIDTNQIDLKPEQVNIRTIRNFELWLRTKKKYCNDYVMRNIQLVKKMLENAVEDGVIQTNPAKYFKFKFDRTKRRIYLDINQLTKLKNCPLPNEDLVRNRDMFLFGCYTGLSYCDIKNFQQSSVIKGSDGSEWIKIIRQKTKVNNDTLLPLLSGAMEILQKYGYVLPISSNAGMNGNLKKISKIAGLNIPLTTHSARKTFGNVLVNDFGVDIKTVSVMMGHRSVLTTEAWYVDIREKKIIRDMNDAMAINW